jgi:hypothetical protein
MYHIFNSAKIYWLPIVWPQFGSEQQRKSLLLLSLFSNGVDIGKHLGEDVYQGEKQSKSYRLKTHGALDGSYCFSSQERPQWGTFELQVRIDC